MIAADLVKISLRQIYRNRRRYRGAILGISLGIAALITVTTVGDSVEGTLGTNLEVLGNATVVRVGWDHGRALRWHPGQYYDKDVEALKQLPGVYGVAPAVWRMADARYHTKRSTTKLLGVGPGFFKIMLMPLLKGRHINREDIEERRHVCIIGEELEKVLFRGKKESLGRQIILAGVTFEVVGILGGGVEDKSLLKASLIPISVARAEVPKMYELSKIYVRAVNWDIVPELHRGIKRVLYSHQPGYKKAMQVLYSPHMIDKINKIVFTFKFFLYAAIVVTLLLGGVGVSMVMLAVVAERTQEIGLKKAVGATQGAILFQFLFESLAVSLLGAFAGILVGGILVQILQGILRIEPNYSVFMLSLIGSVGVGTVIGVVSGVAPARKASRLDPVDAMRFE
ncbi:ABC transporter permease [Thermodesulfobacteriota bacterium]